MKIIADHFLTDEEIVEDIRRRILAAYDPLAPSRVGEDTRALPPVSQEWVATDWEKKPSMLRRMMGKE